MQGIGDAAQGWINTLLYLFASSKLRKRLFWDQFRKICCKTQTEVQQICDMENAEIVRDSGVQKMHSKTYSSFETVSLSSVHTGIGAASDNYSGTPLNGHPSTADTCDITDNNIILKVRNVSP